MSNPYDSHRSEVSLPADVRASQSTPASHRRSADRIDQLDVSEKWKKRFRAIERAGGPELPVFRDLSVSERHLITFNWLAFLFWPIYLPLKGLWRQAIAYFVISLVCVVVLDALGFGTLSRGVGYGMGAVAMMRANVGYYRKVLAGNAPWF